jgi:hypothetical protein
LIDARHLRRSGDWFDLSTGDGPLLSSSPGFGTVFKALRRTDGSASPGRSTDAPGFHLIDDLEVNRHTRFEVNEVVA